LAGRSRTSAIFAMNSWFADAGSTPPAMPTWPPYASSCPGPASSQVGFSIGLMRAGYSGAVAAWAGFTLPSAVLLVLFAYGAGTLGEAIGDGLLHGLKLAAVAIVAQAIFEMARALCSDRERDSISRHVRLDRVACFDFDCPDRPDCARCCCRIGSVSKSTDAGRKQPHSADVSPRKLCSTGSLFALLIGLPLLASALGTKWIELFGAFYRSGALVFGGGHVVLPLLREAFVASGWVSDEAFLPVTVPRKLSRAALHLRRLSRQRRCAIAPPAWRRSRSRCHLSTWVSGAARDAAVVEQVAPARLRSGSDARRESSRCWNTGRSTLRSRMDHIVQGAGGLRARLGPPLLFCRFGAPHRCWWSF
jgi:chromate transport protein ChrA